MEEQQQVYADIAKRLRGLRDAMGIDVAETAKRTGFSTEKVEEYESGTVEIPASYIFVISKTFGVDANVIMSGTESHLHNYTLVKSGHGMVIDRRKDYDYMSLAYRFVGRKMEPFLVTVPPKNADQMTFNEHPGQEFIYLLEGSIEVALGDKVHTMEAGDCLYLDSHIPHAMRALNNKPAIFLDVLI